MKTTVNSATLPSFTYYRLGKDLLDNNQHEAAAQALDEAIHRGQCLADAYFLRGKLHLDTGELSLAASAFRKALHNQTTQAADCQYLLNHVISLRKREVYFRALRRRNRNIHSVAV